MRQVLRIALSSTSMHLRDRFLLIVQRARLRAGSLIVALTGSVSFWIVSSCLAHDGVDVAVLPAMLSGFAPFIGLSAFLIILSLLFCLLVSTTERIFTDEGDGVVPEPHLKSKWHRVAYCPSDMIIPRISLQEHSPPVVLFS